MERIIRSGVIILIFSLFFPIHHVFVTKYSFKIGTFSDFSSIYLYLSDIIVLLLIIFAWKSAKIGLKKHYLLILLAFWLAAGLWFHYPAVSLLGVYFWLRLIEVLLLYVIISEHFRQLKPQKLIFLFTGLGAIEAIITIIQFLSQKSVGLYRLGESHLSPSLFGVAKIVSHGTSYIRAYGTFPHPNVLSAFLMTAVLFSYYLILTASKKSLLTAYIGFLILNVFGLLLTFSRAGILAGLIGSILFFVYIFFTKEYKKRTLLMLGITLVTTILGVIMLQKFIFTRTTVTDAAVEERAIYNQAALNIIRAYPIQGIGYGTSLLHMEQFSPVKLATWQIQPIHNYYLLAIAETGIIGGLLFILFFLWHMFMILKQILNNYKTSLWSACLAIIFMCFLFLMLFDHYFYTLEQPQLLLWLILGLIMSEIAKGQRTIYDTPSRP